MNAARKAVFDCNVYLQAMISARGPAHECWRRVIAGEVQLYASPFILKEIRKLPEHPKLRKFRKLSPERIEAFIVELLEVAEIIDEPPILFDYARDPDDALYVNLAIATGAMLVVSNDKDLLDLMNDENEDGKTLRANFPQFSVLTPPEFIAVLGIAKQ